MDDSIHGIKYHCTKQNIDAVYSILTANIGNKDSE